MLKKINTLLFVLPLLISQISSGMCAAQMFASAAFVMNSNDSGCGSLREAAARFNREPGIRSIVFMISGSRNPKIILKSDIIIEGSGDKLDAWRAQGYTIGCNQLNNSITIEGKGSLIINSPLVTVDPSIQKN